MMYLLRTAGPASLIQVFVHHGLDRDWSYYVDDFRLPSQPVCVSASQQLPFNPLRLALAQVSVDGLVAALAFPPIACSFARKRRRYVSTGYTGNAECRLA